MSSCNAFQATADAYDPRAHGARCDLCPLQGQAFVPPERAKKPIKLIIVGEGPGRVEVRFGRPFIGPSGRYLDTLLGSFDRQAAHVTNGMLCRSDLEKELPRAAACCAPRLLSELSPLPSDIPILTLGKPAATAVLGVKSLFVARGFVWTAKEIDESAIRSAERILKKERRSTQRESKQLRLAALKGRAALAGRTVFPTIHPAFVMRADTWGPILALDVARAVRAADGDKLVLRDQGPYDVVCKPREVAAALARLGPNVATDVETDDVLPLETKMLCAGVSDGERTVVIHPWRRGHARLLQRFFESRAEVTMHNGYAFDQIVYRQHGVRFDKVQLEDTLIAHHAFASHLPQRLDHVVASYVDAAPWKVRFGRRGQEEKGQAPATMSAAELTMYNAADCRLTALAKAAMAADLAPENAVYQHDKALAVLCQEMQIAGMRIDVRRRNLLSKKMKARQAALKGGMRRLIRWEEFAPSKPDHVRWALFTRLRAPMLTPTSTGLASTAAETLEALKVTGTRAGRLADMLLKWRVVIKVRSTYIEAPHIGPDGRVHYNWKSFGTVSGRLACRVQSAPRWSPATEDRVREIYVPAKGHRFVYFDVSQAEMRLAAYLSGDETFMAACKGDLHANNAKVLFPEAAKKGWLDGDAKKDPKRGKPFRDIAKNAGFAVTYCAEAETIYKFLNSHGFPIELPLVEAMLDRLRTAYRGYFRYVDRNVARVRECGYMRSPFVGRIRWLGWTPVPTDCANMPVQSALADVMNIRLIAMRPRLPRGCRLIAQVHDAAIFECREGAATRLLRNLIQETWAEELSIEGRRFVLPIELKEGDRWSDLG